MKGVADEKRMKLDERVKLKTKNITTRGKRHERQRADRKRRAYHLCVGGHKLRREKKEERGSKIKREEAEKKEGERRVLGQSVK